MGKMNEDVKKLQRAPKDTKLITGREKRKRCGLEGNGWWGRRNGLKGGEGKITTLRRGQGFSKELPVSDTGGGSAVYSNVNGGKTKCGGRKITQQRGKK